jgi:predicted enzyme related to lactoylglutathione lyase
MHTNTFLRFAALLAVALAAVGSSLPVLAAKFPPLNSPPATGSIPGKLVWADLFTADPAGATKFYCGLLGWTATALNQKGKGYTVFYNQGRPVAGLAPRSVAAANHPSRWIGYFAVADIAAALKVATQNGGTVRAPSTRFPNRGYQAIISDKDDIPIGLLQSSSGDSPDIGTRNSEWNWFELYVPKPKDSSDFYHAAVGFGVTPEPNSDRKSDFVLSSAGEARGGIAPLPDGEDVKPCWLGVIRVADIDATLAKLPGLGGEVLLAPHTVELGSRFAILLDPTGGTLGLVDYVESDTPPKSQ